MVNVAVFSNFSPPASDPEKYSFFGRGGAKIVLERIFCGCENYSIALSVPRAGIIIRSSSWCARNSLLHRKMTV